MLLLFLALMAGVTVIWIEVLLGVRMAKEAALYADEALRDRSANVRSVGQVIAVLLGFALWLPLLIFNVLAFQSAWPITRRGLRPRRL